jgi:hypothetical protein
MKGWRQPSPQSWVGTDKGCSRGLRLLAGTLLYFHRDLELFMGRGKEARWHRGGHKPEASNKRPSEAGVEASLKAMISRSSEGWHLVTYM